MAIARRDDKDAKKTERHNFHSLSTARFNLTAPAPNHRCPNPLFSILFESFPSSSSAEKCNHDTRP